MSMKILMGLVIALGVGAAAFLVMHGYEDVPTDVGEEIEEVSDEPSDVAEGPEDVVRNEGPSNTEMFDNIEASIAANPQDRVRAYKYGAALIGLGEFERAEKFYLEQLDLFPADVQIAYGLGWCYEQSKQWQKAVNAYTTATLIDPRHRMSKNNLAWVLATAPESKVRNGSRAVALARQAVGKQQPPDPRLMDTLGAAYAELGNFQNAIRIQKYVSNKTKGDNEGVEKRLKLYLKRKPFRMAK